MAPRRIAQSCLLICLLALAAVQSTGLGAAFLCFCSGQAFVTSVAACHGPHGEHCLTPASAQECGEDSHEPCDTEQHTALTEKLANLQAGQVSAPEAGVGLIERVLSFSEMLRVRPPCSGPLVHADRSSRPPPGISIARTIILQI